DCVIACGRHIEHVRCRIVGQRELLDLGLPSDKATAIANDVLFVDWLTFRAQLILRCYTLDESAEAVTRVKRRFRFHYFRSVQLPRRPDQSIELSMIYICDNPCPITLRL